MANFSNVSQPPVSSSLRLSIREHCEKNLDKSHTRNSQNISKWPVHEIPAKVSKFRGGSDPRNLIPFKVNIYSKIKG